jgi:hypothetical protein
MALNSPNVVQFLGLGGISILISKTIMGLILVLLRFIFIKKLGHDFGSSFLM